MTQIKQMAWAMAAAIILGMGMVSTATAGALPAAKHTDDRVDGFATDTYVIFFEADEPAVVVLKGDGDTILDLKVYDENGRLIAADGDDGSGALVKWTPRWSGKYIIKVVNHGPVYNHYRLGTN